MAVLIIIGRIAALTITLGLSACGGRSMPPDTDFGAATSLSCVPYAREVSGIELSGDAWQWWREADGRYARGNTPRLGAVLVFRAKRAMPQGHLAVVTAIQNSRTILVTQSNWLPRRIERDPPVTDVSDANDWTLVRVYYEPAQAMGVTAYKTYGFVYPP
jgi:surface antigen